MVDLNATVAFLSPYFSTVEGVVNTLGLLAFGVFGIYLASFIAKIYFYKKIYKSFNDVKLSVERIEGKIDRMGKKKG
jgi:hypothetical protein